jgi:hypothetical protein
MVKRETRRGCLGGFYEWGESEGARRGPFIGRRGRARGWPVGGAGAVSVEAPVVGMVRRAWAASAGAEVMSLARWRCRVTTDETGSSGTCGHGRRLSSPPARQGSALRGQGMGERCMRRRRHGFSHARVDSQERGRMHWR